jgi:hypothetical protein
VLQNVLYLNENISWRNLRTNRQQNISISLFFAKFTGAYGIVLGHLNVREYHSIEMLTLSDWK